MAEASPSTPSRKLAAIMFTDIVGYTALMGKDSQKALKVLETSKSFQRKLVEQHHGKWLKEMGDGVLASFSSALDAVNCAVEIQKAARGEMDEKLRIGIHLGDVTIEENDVHGDGVNVASRLEAVADPGGIYISEAIHNAIQGQTEVQSQFLGELNLKNVAYPVRSYAIQGIGLPVPKKKVTPINQSKPLGIAALAVLIVLGLVYYFMFWKEASENNSIAIPQEVDSKSIAVLAFDDMSADGDQEYLGDGVAEEILNVLANIKELKVIGRTSSFSYKGKDIPLTTIGQELGVSTILEGSVRKDGNQIRITAQLINATDGAHLWSETYDRELKNIFQIQDEIAQEIANNLFSSLDLDVNDFSGGRTTDEDAYDYYLLGNYYYENRQVSRTNIFKALENYKKAMDLDPNFADAVASVSRVYGHIGFTGQELESEDPWEQANYFAKKALDLDPNNAKALFSLAYIKRTNDWEWESAHEFYRKSIRASNGNQEQILQGYALFLATINEHDSAIYYARRARELNPQSRVTWRHLYRVYYYSRNFAEALEEYENGIWKDDFLIVRLLAQLDKDRAVKVIIDNWDIDDKIKLELNAIYEENGWEAFARALYNYYLEQSEESRFFSTLILVNGAPKDKLFAELNQWIDDKRGGMVYLLTDPVFDPIRDDPRYEALLVRMGLDKYK